MKKINEFGLSRSQTKQSLSRYDDLQIQAMMFDLDIDIETFSLVEKQQDTTPGWLRAWNDKRRLADNDPASPEQGWA